MQKRILHFGAAVFVLSMVITGCKKADTAAIAPDPQLTFALIPDNPMVTFAASKPGNGLAVATANSKQAFMWTAGTANITRFKLNASRGGAAAEYSSGSLTNVNLFLLSSLLSTISIPKGDYTTAKVGIIFTQTTTTAYPIQLLGTYTNSAGILVPVEFDMNDNIEIDMNLTNIIADGTKDFTANIAMHLNLFLTSIAANDIDAAIRTNGTILITKTINTTLYNRIKANMLVCAGSTLASALKH